MEEPNASPTTPIFDITPAPTLPVDFPVGGFMPFHTGFVDGVTNVALAHKTVLTSPAFHCIYDEDFTTASNADPTAATLDDLDGVI